MWWAWLVPVGIHWYTGIAAAIGGIRVCSPTRTLPVGTRWDYTGAVGNRRYSAKRA